jgi:hypothetical protein
MRAPCVFLAAALLLSSAGCATSDTLPRPDAQQIADLEGLYSLSDGHRAYVFGMDARLYISIDGRQQKELFVAGPNRFVSRNGDVAILVPADRGEDDRIVLEYVRYPGQHVPVRFASGPRPGRGYVD